MALLKNKQQTLTPAEVRQKEIEAEEGRREALAKMSIDDVPLNFQKLEIIEAKIAILGKRYNEISPLVQEEIKKTGSFNGKYSKLQQKIDGEINVLRKKQTELRKTIYDANEPATDPVKAVLEKYKWAEVHNKRIKLIGTVIRDIEDLMATIQEIDRLEIPRPFTPKTEHREDIISLGALRQNFALELSHLPPMTEETKKAEVAEAVNIVTKMMAKAQEEKSLVSELSAI